GVFAGRTDLVRSVAHGDKASRDTSIGLRDLETGKVVRTIPNIGNEFHSVCFSADGKHLLTATTDDINGIRILDVETGEELLRINAPNAGGWPFAFSPDGKRIVCMMRVWDLATGKELRKYEGHSDGVTGVRFFPDSQRIVSTSYDGTAQIWRARHSFKGADEASAVKAVEYLGGKVTRDDKLPGKPVIGVNLAGAQVTDAGLKQLADLKQLTTLDLSGDHEVEDGGLEALELHKQNTT